ncbi:hypothetical protein Tco_0589667, partial [Tanacetum coccineum]
NRAHLEDYQELSKVGSVTFGGSKGSISGKDSWNNNLLQLIEKVKKLENKLRKKRKSKGAKDADGQDQEVPFETDQGDTFVTPEKSKGSG